MNRVNVLQAKLKGLNLPGTRRAVAGGKNAWSAAFGAAKAAYERGDYREAGTLFSKAQRLMHAGGSGDVRIEAEALASVATIAAETVDMELAKRARSTYEKMEWPASLRAERFAAVSALRAIALLEGDSSGAFFAAREAVYLAPVPRSKPLRETQLAAVCRMLGDLGSERLQLRRAWELLRPHNAKQFDPVLCYAYAALRRRRRESSRPTLARRWRRTDRSLRRHLPRSIRGSKPSVPSLPRASLLQRAIVPAPFATIARPSPPGNVSASTCERS